MHNRINWTRGIFAALALWAIATFLPAVFSSYNLPVSGQVAAVATAIAPIESAAQAADELVSQEEIVLTETVAAPKVAEAGVAAPQSTNACRVTLMQRLYKSRWVELVLTGRENCGTDDRVTGNLWAWKAANNTTFNNTPIDFAPISIQLGHNVYDDTWHRLTVGDKMFTRMALNGQVFLDTDTVATQLHPVFAELLEGPFPEEPGICLIIRGHVDPHGFATFDGGPEQTKHLNTEDWVWKFTAEQLPNTPTIGQVNFKAYDTADKRGFRGENNWRNVRNGCYVPPTPTNTATQTATATASPTPTLTATAAVQSGWGFDVTCSNATGWLQNASIVGSINVNGREVQVNETATTRRDYNVPLTLTGAVNVTWNLVYTPSQGTAENLNGAKALDCGGTTPTVTTPTTTLTPTTTATPTSVAGSGSASAACKGYGATLTSGSRLNVSFTATDRLGTVTESVEINTGAVSHSWNRPLRGLTSFSWNGTVTSVDGSTSPISGTHSENCGEEETVTPPPTNTTQVVRNKPTGEVISVPTCYGRVIGLKVAHQIDQVLAIELRDTQGHVFALFNPQYWDGSEARTDRNTIFVPHWITRDGLSARMLVRYKPIEGGMLTLDEWFPLGDIASVTDEDLGELDCQRQQLDCSTGAYSYYRAPNPALDDVDAVRHYMADSTVNMAVFRGNYEAFEAGDTSAGSFKNLTLPYTGMTNDGQWFAFSTTDTSFYDGVGMYKPMGGRVVNNTQPGWQALDILPGGYIRLECETGKRLVEVCKSVNWSTGEMTTELVTEEEAANRELPPACQPPHNGGTPQFNPQPREVCAYLDANGLPVRVPESDLQRILREKGLDAPACTAGDGGNNIEGSLMTLLMLPALTWYYHNQRRKALAELAA